VARRYRARLTGRAS